jgi:hypothetical protein
MQRDRVLQAVDAIAACIASGADELVALRAAGFGPEESRVIVDTLPEAFALPAMEDLGVVVSNVASAKDSAGRWAEISLAECSFFQAALNLAREHRAFGTLSQETYKAIAERSSLVNAVSNALNAGADVNGATLAMALVGARAEDFGSRPWYSRLWGRNAG